MLSPLDDFPIHQVPKPIATPASTDRNAYGRYWFGAVRRDGSAMVEMAFGRYANLRVCDASLSISVGDEQHSFHASREAPIDATDLTVGPFRLEITEPLRALRITIDDNETGITADLEWRARTGALEEDHTVMTDGPRVIVDMLRFVQFGTWAGWVTAAGATTRFDHADTFGTRDRSWGIRPVGEPVGGRPGRGAANAWIWAPIHFEQSCRIVGYFQRFGGAFWRADGHTIPVLDPVPATVDIDTPGVGRLDPVGQRFEFEPGTRWLRRGEIDVVDAAGVRGTMSFECLRRFDMRGIGYMNPDWGHGVWKGEQAVGAEHWRFADVSATDPTHQHVHNLVRARFGDEEGVGFVEQINTIESALEIIQKSGHPQATVIVDPFHNFRGGGSFASLAKLKGDQIAISHFNDSPGQPAAHLQGDADRVLPGDGVVDLRRYVALLKQIDYNRFLSLELFREDLWQRDPLDVARLGLEKMRAVCEG